MWHRVYLQTFTDIAEQLDAQFYALKMESAGSSEKSTNFYQVTSRHTSEDNFLHSQRHENLKFHVCDSINK